MDSILEMLSELFEMRTAQIQADFLYNDEMGQNLIKAYAAISHEKRDDALCDLFLADNAIDELKDLIVNNVAAGQKKMFDGSIYEGKMADRLIKIYKEHGGAQEYGPKYRDSESIYRALVATVFGHYLMEPINTVLCKDPRIDEQLSVVRFANSRGYELDRYEIKQALNEMNNYYSSQCYEYKPIKTFINKVWNNENISIVDSGAAGAFWGAIFGGPIGMVAGAALGSMWADNKKASTYRRMRGL